MWRPSSNYFDLVIGTSSGGIISLGLTVPNASGRPKFSARDLLALYAAKGTTIFEPWEPTDAIAEAERAVAGQIADLGLLDPFNDATVAKSVGKPVPAWKALFHPKYSAHGLEAILKMLMGTAQLSEPVSGTHVAVNSFDTNSFRLKMFRSWEAQASAENDFPMWAVARAAASVPTLFPPARVTSVDDGKTLHCVDGALGVHDPVLVGYAEARHMLVTQWNAVADTPVFVLSISTGTPPAHTISYADVKDAGLVGWYRHGLMNVLIQGPDNATNRIADVLLPKGSFYRYQVPLSGPGFSASAEIDDCTEANIANIQKASADFLDREKVFLTSIVRRLRDGGPPIA